MKVRYGGEYRRLQQERNLLLWAFILLAILTLLLMWQYEVRIEQLERLHHPQGYAPARTPAQGAFSISERSGAPRGCAGTEGSAIARTDAGCA